MEVLNNLNEKEKTLNRFKKEKDDLKKEKSNHSIREKSRLIEFKFILNILFLYLGFLFSSLLLELQKYSNDIYSLGITVFIASFFSFFSFLPIINSLTKFNENYIKTKINYLDSLKNDHYAIITSLGFSLSCLISFLIYSFYNVVYISQISLVISSALGVCFLLHVISFVFENIFTIGNVNYINSGKYKEIREKESLIFEEEKKYIKKTKEDILNSCSNFCKFELLEEQINNSKAPLLYSLFITSREDYAKKLGFSDFATLRRNELEKIAIMEIIETS